jgi:hypothetical protein
MTSISRAAGFWQQWRLLLFGLTCAKLGVFPNG